MSASAAEAAGSSADRQQLEDLINLGADVELHFDDGTLMVNSVVLSLFSGVLRGAVEANAGAASSSVESGNKQSSSNSSSSDSQQRSIPLKGVVKDEWLEMAAFCYPVPPPTIRNWSQVEKLLKIGTQFDIQVVLRKVDQWLLSRAGLLVSSKSMPSAASGSVWKWLQLADESGLELSLAAIARRAVQVDKLGCSIDDNLRGLSTQGLKQLIKMLSLAQLQPALPTTCPSCSQITTCCCSYCGCI